MDLAQVKQVLAGIAAPADLHRIGGGSETDVYAAGQGRYVYKVKELAVTTVDAAHEEIATMRAMAARFAAYLGPAHSIPTQFVLSEDGDGRYYAVSIQPYLHTARPLAAVDIPMLDRAERTAVEWQMVSLLRSALRCYHDTGHMPDLYGTFSRSITERQRMNAPLRWPWRIWTFFTQRLGSAHNLLLLDEPTPRIVLVDYDRVRWRGLWGRFYYAICWLLLGRDLLWLAVRQATEQFVTTKPTHRPAPVAQPARRGLEKVSHVQ